MSTLGKNYPNQFPKKNWNPSEARGKLESYCAYQERCVWEVKRKLAENGLHGDIVENITESLIRDGFLDQKRFARSFARGKFRLKKWGRVKIVRELKLREISQSDIQEGLQEIDASAYFDTLSTLCENLWHKINEKDTYKKRYLVIQRLISKGFEEELIRESLKIIQSQ